MSEVWRDKLNNRVVITGYECVTPFGFGADVLWKSLIAGRNGITVIEEFKAFQNIVNIAATIPKVEFHYEQDEEMEKISGEERIFLEVALQALKNSSLEVSYLKTKRVFYAIADRKPNFIKNFRDFLHVIRDAKGENYDERFKDLLIENRSIIENHKNNLSINHYFPRAIKVLGQQMSIATACASSNNAIGEAYLKIKFGLIDVAFAGGAYCYDLNAMIGFSRLGALSTNKDPDAASCPFDAKRDGFVMGSGSGVLVLEEYEAAKNRGAHILGEIVGYSSYCDAYRVTDSDPDAKCAAKAMEDCLSQANLKGSDVQYINAHGTSTVMNDLMETRAIKRTFGKYAYSIPISSTKSMIGHSIMASAAIEAIVCLKSMETSKIHRNRNLIQTGEEMDLNFVVGESREQKIEYAISNSFGFGGQNTSIVLRNI